MFSLLAKIFRTPNTVIPAAAFIDTDTELQAVGTQLEKKIQKFFRGSLAIRQVDVGSDNAAEQECIALGNAYYDAERFGVHFVASTKHADMLMVTGPVSRNSREALIRAYETTPDPKIVVAVGDDAIDGGIFKGSYAIEGGVSSVIPVDFNIPGDPPSPKEMICHLLRILGAVEETGARTLTPTLSQRERGQTRNQ